MIVYDELDGCLVRRVAFMNGSFPADKEEITMDVQSSLAISLDDIDLSDIDLFDVEVLSSPNSMALPEAGASSTPWYSCSCSCPNLPMPGEG